MVILLQKGATGAQRDAICDWLRGRGVTPDVSVGSDQTIVGCVGDVSRIDTGLVKVLDGVESVKRIQEPYKLANRKFHPADTVVDCGGVTLGGGAFRVIAGPCSVESEEQVIEVAKAVKAAGATMLRGGAFKPRTSPYSFQGMGPDGLTLLLEAKKETGLPIVTELMSFGQLPLFEDVDVIQVGARNMQNFELLKELGAHTKKPILLKRGLSATLEELLMSAEYVMNAGNPNVMLCERGIRTFERATRNTLDLSVVPVLHGLSHLPVIVDPSHATGRAALVKSIALAATVIGADGLIIEVHNNPKCALCDGAQSQTPEMFADTMRAVSAVRPFACREII